MMHWFQDSPLRAEQCLYTDSKSATLCIAADALQEENSLINILNNVLMKTWRCKQFLEELENITYHYFQIKKQTNKQ